MAKIIKTNKSETIEGTNDDDVILANGGDDSIWAWKGDDKILAGDGNDVIGVYQGKDSVDGGKGLDYLYFYHARGGVSIDLASGSVQFNAGGQGKTTFKSIEGVYGSDGSDRVSGTAGDNNLYSGAGSDTIDGRGGDDTMNAYTGNDEILGGGGNDTLYIAPGDDSYDGGGGRDALDFYFDKSGVDVSLAAGTAMFQSKEGTGVTTFTNVENLVGSLKDDTLTGDDNANTLGGRSGDDTIIGGGGDDALGGAEGHDELTGEAGADAFVFSSFKAADTDTVTDFDAAEDMIALFKSSFKVTGRGDVTTVGEFKIKTLADAQFEANESGEATASETRLIYETDTGILWYDINGSAAGKRHMVAQLDAELTVTIDNFLVVM